MASADDVRALFRDEDEALLAEATAEMNAYAAEGRLGDLPGLMQPIDPPPGLEAAS